MEIKSIVDAPYGDFNWMKLLTLAPDVNYTGIDIVPDLIPNNIKNMKISAPFHSGWSCSRSLAER
jgi:hypothetical protein